MSQRSWHPGSLLQVSGSYWEAFTLHTGVKLDLFTLLGSNPKHAADIARKVKGDVRGMTLLLNALAAMGLLSKVGDTYQCTASAEQFLNRQSEAYIGHMIMHHHHLADSWARMDDAVIAGKPLRSRVLHDNGQRREAFLLGMYNIASQQAPKVADVVDLTDCKRLLDLGGGPGTYAIHFCSNNPRLEAVVYDLATTRPFAENTIAQHGLSERVTFVPGNYIDEEIPGRYDVVWISHILHAEGPEICEQIIAKAVGVLEPGGKIIIHDFILNENMDGPLFPALFALNMLQGTEAGQSYSEQQITQMLHKNGVCSIERLDYVGPTESGIVIGVLPAQGH